MPCRRTAIWTLVSIVLLWACKNDSEPPLPEPPRNGRNPLDLVPSASSNDVGDRTDAGTPPWIKHRLADLRDRTLKWTPREVPLRQIAFSGDRLFAIRGSHVEVIDASAKSEIVRHDISAPCQLIALADGSVLALGSKSTLRIRPNARSPESVGQVVLFPQSLVFGNASDATRLDVFDVVSGQVLGFGPSDHPTFSSLWLPDVTLEVPELKRANCGHLLDGSYACVAGNQLFHLNSRSRPKSIGRLPVELPVWRVLGAARADQVWLARNDGQLEKWWFGPPPKKLASIQLPWTPLDLSVKKHTIAVVRIAQDRAKPKELTLVVLDTEGHLRFERSLMPATEQDVNLAEKELGEVEVLVHAKQPWIAVHTSRGVRVVHSETGETLLESE